MQKPLFLLAMTAMFLTLTACSGAVSAGDDTVSQSSSSVSSAKTAAFVAEGCKVGGCSAQFCVDESDEDVISTCEWTAAYACFQTGRCERQDNGECGWSRTDELVACLGAAE